MDENYDNVALIYRSNEDDVFVFFKNFGKLEVYKIIMHKISDKLKKAMPYCDFISLPYFREISLRKLIYQHEKKIDISKKIHKVMREINKAIEEDNKNILSEMYNEIFSVKNQEIFTKIK